MSDEQNTVQVPVLELEYDKLVEILKNVTDIDAVTTISMPNHVKEYATKDKITIGNLVNELVSYEQGGEHEWRLRREWNVGGGTMVDGNIAIAGKTLYDAYRVIVIAKMNAVYIIPGEKSIKEKEFQPNEIIKLTNLLSRQLFLLSFEDVMADDRPGGYDLKISLKRVDQQ